MESKVMKVLVTGASGMLGRSLLRLLAASPERFEVVGTGFSRVVPPLRRLDLRDDEATNELFEDVKPDVVVHCAAERDPDKADKDPEGLVKLNVDSSAKMARLCRSHNVTIVYLSTDYVFDGGVGTGVLPPYGIDAPTAPVNLYGVSKRDGEIAVLAEGGPTAVSVRVPVMYALDCLDVSESASLTVAKTLLHKNPTQVDDWGVRFPTCVDDVAAVLQGILDVKRADPSRASGIFHCSSGESSTKYKMVLMMAELTGLSAEHISPNPNPAAGAPRPQNTQLECSATWSAIGFEHKFMPLREGFALALARFGGSSEL